MDRAFGTRGFAFSVRALYSTGCRRNIASSDAFRAHVLGGMMLPAIEFDHRRYSLTFPFDS